MPASQVRQAVVRYLRRKSDEVRRFIATDTGAVKFPAKWLRGTGYAPGKALRG